MMDRRDIDEELKKLENQVVKSFHNATILDNVCNVKEVTQDYRKDQFSQFAKKIDIERSHILDSSHILLIGELGLSVARSEINLLLHDFAEKSKHVKIDDFSIEKIAEIVYDLQANDFEPSAVFIPTQYFDKVFEWNQKFLEMLKQPEISYLRSLIIDNNTVLRVLYSSKYAKFDNVMIVSKYANIWEFRPDEDTGNRLTAKFDWDSSEIDVPLLIRTRFNFEIKSTEANVSLDFPKHTNKK